jgi:hypothetical protein
MRKDRRLSSTVYLLSWPSNSIVELFPEKDPFQWRKVDYLSLLLNV